MSLGPSGDTGNAGAPAADEFDTAHRTLSLLNTAAQVALKTREDAGDEAQRVIAGAHEEAERIRAEARGDSPELRRATEQLREELQRSLDAVEAMRDQLGTLLETYREQTQPADR